MKLADMIAGAAMGAIAAAAVTFLVMLLVFPSPHKPKHHPAVLTNVGELIQASTGFDAAQVDSAGLSVVTQKVMAKGLVKKDHVEYGDRGDSLLVHKGDAWVLLDVVIKDTYGSGKTFRLHVKVFSRAKIWYPYNYIIHRVLTPKA